MPNPAAHVGRSRTVEDRILAGPLLRLAATMGWPAPDSAPGAAIPPLWHWLYGLPAVPDADLGPDGHERLGLMMPAVPDALRMWAGSDVAFLDPLRVGDRVTVSSTVAAVDEKEGRNGRLVFVTVLHDYRRGAELCVRDRQTVVYRPIGAAAAPAAAEEAECGAGGLSETQLFRYSALTFNSHRIHLDRDFCAAETGDPRLVVHGPLLATILARAAGQALKAPLARFAFRLHAPTRAGERFTLHSRAEESGEAHLRIDGPRGDLRVAATAWPVA